MVECQIVALKVVGSSPIIRPKTFPVKNRINFNFLRVKKKSRNSETLFLKKKK